MNTAYLGLGSNLGNRLAFLRSGRDTLTDGSDIVLLQAAGIYETEAIGGPPDNPKFLNTVLAIETALEPRQLLARCLAVEDEFGRSRPVRWAPRTLDIDILLYADRVVCEEDLVIPHPRLQERAFVLAPLQEIAAAFRHPVLEQTIRELAAGSEDVTALQPLHSHW
ncbi:MAG: 2-amino-4-hydroxy-6-hydroxymethyldihydropteridine diphosphokinase [Desulfuromonadales bacterium]|jgi:2-amino-4-hydroxy-6-hydroxymethyldihydropteridine diphosphokinase